jgi:hypothetical protein
VVLSDDSGAAISQYEIGTGEVNPGDLPRLALILKRLRQGRGRSTLEMTLFLPLFLAILHRRDRERWGLCSMGRSR